MSLNITSVVVPEFVSWKFEIELNGNVSEMKLGTVGHDGCGK